MPENKDDINLEGWDLFRAASDTTIADIVRALIARGDDLNTRDKNGFTPLHVAAWRNSLEVARMLIEKGADIEAKDNDGGTPLHDAARPSCLNIARLLIERGANTDGIDLRWIPD